MPVTGTAGISVASAVLTSNGSTDMLFNRHVSSHTNHAVNH